VTPPPLTDADQRALITGDHLVDGRDGLAETLFVEAGAGSGKTKSLVDRVVALVLRGVPLRHIAAITFTEKAAAELRDRIRLRLEARHRDPATPAQDAARCAEALRDVDAAAISTLHAFAQRILTEHPIEAELPPNVDVLDEVASEIAFEERWRAFRDELLDDPALERTLLLADALGVGLDGIRQLAVEFDANWDLATDPDRVPWQADEPPALDVHPCLAIVDELEAARASCTDPSDTLLPHLEAIAGFGGALRGAADEYETLGWLAGDDGRGHLNAGRASNWPEPDKATLQQHMRDLRRARDEACAGITAAVLQRLAVEARTFVIRCAGERRREGRLEFHDLLVMARQLLRGEHGTAVRHALRERYQRLLLDEFQDTDPIQIELAVLIASPHAIAGQQPWDQVEVDPGRLFFVGDPKQSIYRFRRADIALFLRARGRFAAEPVEPVRLTTNFRTTPPIVAWVNHVFGRLIQPAEASQPEYQPLAPSPLRTAAPCGPGVALLGIEPLDRAVHAADDVRAAEARAVADTITRAVTEPWQILDRAAGEPDRWRDCELGDITVLLPARTSLPMLEDALDRYGIAYRAESSSLVYSTREVRDLMAAMRAVADPTDALALVTALRSALFGCGDDDLVTWKARHGGGWNLRAPLPEDAPEDHPVRVALRLLRSLHDRGPWTTPSELLDTLCRERRLFELGYAQGRPRDLWRRLRFVIDQARAWHQAEGGTLREYLDWARMQASESARVAETILPESDDDSVRIMTIHASKGLEFPVTILSGLSTGSRRPRSGVQVVWPPDGAVGIKASASVTTPQYDDFKPIDEQMDHHERLRLLYVAATRAQDHLVVSLFRKSRAHAPDHPSKLTSAELLAEATEQAPGQVSLTGTSAARPTPARPAGDDRPALVEHATWQAERERALSTSARRRSVGASDVQRMLQAQLDEGDQKDALDLDLPAWRKGRYGTAVGRAVHAVLQTVDLASGAGLDDAVAAQAAAEGVIGLEDAIAELARAALGSPSVRQAAVNERWRETYVATSIGDITLEGYIDLLYRGPDGLVVVDYKTASSSSDLDQRLAHYRSQGGAYALAVARATGQDVARVVFVFLTPDGAIERELPDLAAATADVRQALATS